MQDVALSLGDRSYGTGCVAGAPLRPSFLRWRRTRSQAHICWMRAIQLARTLGDEATEAHALWNTLLLNLYTGTAAQGIPAGGRAVALARKLGLRELQGARSSGQGLVYIWDPGAWPRRAKRWLMPRACGADLGSLPCWLKTAPIRHWTGF